jgi:hypothetical protein
MVLASNQCVGSSESEVMVDSQEPFTATLQDGVWIVAERPHHPSLITVLGYRHVQSGKGRLMEVNCKYEFLNTPREWLVV